MDVVLKVTQESFDANFSIDEWFNFFTLTNGEMYEKMLKFVVDVDGNYVDRDTARKMFRAVPKLEWLEYVTRFQKGVVDAFVNPTNGGSSISQSKVEQPQPPAGSIS